MFEYSLSRNFNFYFKEASLRASLLFRFLNWWFFNLWYQISPTRKFLSILSKRNCVYYAEGVGTIRPLDWDLVIGVLLLRFYWLLHIICWACIYLFVCKFYAWIRIWMSCLWFLIWLREIMYGNLLSLGQGIWLFFEQMPRD